MLKRPLIAAALTSAALVMAVGGARQAVSAPRPRVTIGRAKLDRRSVPAVNGAVNILSVKITARNTSILPDGVTAFAELKGVAGTGSTPRALTDTGKGIFTGSVQIPNNASRKRATAIVRLRVQTAERTVEKTIGTVTVDAFSGADPTQPPPPPPI